MSLEILAFLISILLLVMFIIMFVVVIRIWNFLQEVLASGGYPAVIHSRAKKEAVDILRGQPVFNPNRVDEILSILSRFPDDSEAVELIRRLNEQKQDPKK